MLDTWRLWITSTFTVFLQVVNNIMAPSPTDASKHAMDAVIETYEETDHYDEAESWVCFWTSGMYERVDINK